MNGLPDLLSLAVVMVIGAVSATIVGGVIEIVRAYRDPYRRQQMHDRGFMGTVRKMLS